MRSGRRGDSAISGWDLSVIGEPVWIGKGGKGGRGRKEGERES